MLQRNSPVRPIMHEYALGEAKLSEHPVHRTTIERLATTALEPASHTSLLTHEGDVDSFLVIEEALENLLDAPTTITTFYGSAALRTDVRVLAYGRMQYDHPTPRHNQLFAMLESVSYSRKRRTTPSTVGVKLHGEGYTLSSKNQLGPHALALALQATTPDLAVKYSK